MSLEAVVVVVPPMLLGIGGVLLSVNLAAVLGVRAYARRPVLSVGLLCALAWASGSGFAVAVGDTLGEYLWGRPQLAATDLLPDPHTRLEKRAWTYGCCVCDPRRDDWNNGTLRALTALFGAGPTAYDGPYPSLEAATMLLESGLAPSVGEGRLWVGEQAYPIQTVSPEARIALRALGPRAPLFQGPLTDWDIEAGRILRAVPLRDDALLVDTGEAVQIRIWDGAGGGRVWASYPVPE